MVKTKGKKKRYVTVRISKESHDLLVELAEERGMTKISLLDEAIAAMDKKVIGEELETRKMTRETSKGLRP